MGTFFGNNPEAPLNPAASPVNEAEGFKPELTGFETLAIATSNAYKDNFVMSIALQSSLNELDNGATKRPAKEQNEKYPNMARPFTQPYNDAQALFIFEQQQERARRENLLSLAPDTMTNTGLKFAGGMLGHAFDPVEFGAGYVVGLGVGAVAGAFTTAAELTAVATNMTHKAVMVAPKTARAEAIRGFGRTFADGLLGNAAVEPFIAVPQSQVQDYGLEDAMVSTVGGALMFGLAIGGLRGVGAFLSHRTAVHGEIQKSAMAQMDQGKLPDIEPFVNHEIAQTSYIPKIEDGVFLDGHNTYDYRPSVETEGIPLYAAQRNRKGFGKSSDPLNSFENYGFELGKGKTMTPNIWASNGAGRNGRIFRVKMGNKNVFDLDKTLGSKKGASKAVQSFLGENMGELRTKLINRALMENQGKLDSPFFDATRKKIVTGDLKGKQIDAAELAIKKEGIEVGFNDVSGREIMEAVQEMVHDGKLKNTALDDIQASFKKEGIQGYRHDGSKVAGRDHSKHNVFHMFDDTEMRFEKTITPDKSILPKMRKADAQKIADAELSPQRQRYFDQEIQNKVNDRLQKPITNQEVLDPASKRKEFNDILDKSEKASDSPAIKQEIVELKKMQQEGDDLLDVADAVITCMTGVA